MFPGMGAYSLLSRKVGMRIAEDLITSGNTYKAEDLHKLGIVDIIAPVGEGKKVANDLMRKQEKQINSLKNIYRCRQLVNPVCNTELQNVISAWVDAAMLISEKDLTTMRRLANSQRYQQEIRVLPKSSEALYAPDLVAA
jgi:DSF synthase